tara:strand:+ start:160 stop:501 length:342 start_codon:yes stop_codon:yes gene_type:complete
MTSKVYKIAHNRGKPRVWMEGKFLLDHDIIKGMKFDRLMPHAEQGERDYPLQMTLVFHSKGKHTVAGSETRPIIDLNAAYLNQIFEGCTHYKAIMDLDVTTSKLLIHISGVKQ